MPSPGMRGWYVELDEELVKRFEKDYPEHGSKTMLTSLAVQWAIRLQLFPAAAIKSAQELFFSVDRLPITLTPGGDDVSRQRRNQASDDLSPGSDVSETEGG